MTVLGPGGTGKKLNIPTPAQMPRRTGLVPVPGKVPPVLGKGRHPTAIYWVETNIGIAFQHAGCLPLLVEHYGDQLRVVEDVHAEWENKADQNRLPPSQFASSEERNSYQQWCRVKFACVQLTKSGRSVLGEPEPLAESEVDAVRKLRELLTAMPEADEPLAEDDEWTHLGECSTVRAAELLERDHRVTGRAAPNQVLATNDGKAGRLAKAKGLACRTSAEILREMVLESTGQLDAAAAWALHQQMDQVARIPKQQRPTGPQFFN